jgi:hypothetical protein
MNTNLDMCFWLATVCKTDEKAVLAAAVPLYGTGKGGTDWATSAVLHGIPTFSDWLPRLFVQAISEHNHRPH